jgi:hypothetical protein
MKLSSSRRVWLKQATGAVVAIPLASFATGAWAAKNDPIRTALKYQDTPNADKSCANCLQFVPGKTPKDMGTCKVIPNDTEIKPQGYCTAWVKKA